MNMSTNNPIHKVLIPPAPGAAAAGSTVGVIVTVEADSMLSGNRVSLGKGICVRGTWLGCGLLSLGTKAKVHLPASSSAHHLAR